MQFEELENRRHFASTITPGVSILTGLRSPGVHKQYTVDLVAGQAIVVAAGDAKNNAVTTELILLGPNGKALNKSVGENGSFLGRVAPVTGRYTIRLRDLGQDDTGSVLLTAFWHTPNAADGDDAFAIESGRRRASDLPLGDLDIWSIDTTAGQFVSILATENVPRASDIGVLVIGPDGRGLVNQEDEEGVKIDLPNVKAGRYYAVLYEAGANDVGRYGISFARTPGAQYGGDPDTNTPLKNNVTRAGDLPAGDLDIWDIPIGRGDTFSATFSRTTGSLEPELLLVDPTGKVVATTNGATTTTLNYTPTASGIYWLIGRDREADDGGQFNVKYTRT